MDNISIIFLTIFLTGTLGPMLISSIWFFSRMINKRLSTQEASTGLLLHQLETIQGGQSIISAEIGDLFCQSNSTT